MFGVNAACVLCCCCVVVVFVVCVCVGLFFCLLVFEIVLFGFRRVFVFDLMLC